MEPAGVERCMDQEAVQVIEELIRLAQDMRQANARGKVLGLSADEKDASPLTIPCSYSTHRASRPLSRSMDRDVLPSPHLPHNSRADDLSRWTRGNAAWTPPTMRTVLRSWNGRSSCTMRRCAATVT